MKKIPNPKKNGLFFRVQIWKYFIFREVNPLPFDTDRCYFLDLLKKKTIFFSHLPWNVQRFHLVFNQPLLCEKSYDIFWRSPSARTDNGFSNNGTAFALVSRLFSSCPKWCAKIIHQKHEREKLIKRERVRIYNNNNGELVCEHINTIYRTSYVFVIVLCIMVLISILILYSFIQYGPTTFSKQITYPGKPLIKFSKDFFLFFFSFQCKWNRIVSRDFVR